MLNVDSIPFGIPGECHASEGGNRSSKAAYWVVKTLHETLHASSTNSSGDNLPMEAATALDARVLRCPILCY